MRRAGERPGSQREDSQKSPHRSGAHLLRFAPLVHPRRKLRHQDQRRENEVDNEQHVPGDAILGKRIQHARAEGRKAIQNDVARDAHCVNYKKKRERRRLPFFASMPSCIPTEEYVRQPSKRCSENRQADERVREAAVVARDAERIVRKRINENVHVGKYCAQRRRKYRHTRVSFA